ncbi:MAG: hypothetical protein PF485_03180 [Bacteroidales bacterium]|jgi:hypothetical protein|nr:hypothetical protein [Bacteroidales bacterium]
MKKYIIYIVSVILLFSLTGCPEELPEHDEAIVLLNNSEEDIVWYFINHHVSSDTTQLVESTPWRDIETKKILIGTSYFYEIYSGSIKDLLNEGFLQFYFLNYDTVLTVPWEQIREENIILKKVYFETWEDLEACNFTITYP